MENLTTGLYIVEKFRINVARVFKHDFYDDDNKRRSELHRYEPVTGSYKSYYRPNSYISILYTGILVYW